MTVATTTKDESATAAAATVAAAAASSTEKESANPDVVENQQQAQRQQPQLQVVAPSDLPGGYELHVDYEGTPAVVRVVRVCVRVCPGFLRHSDPTRLDSRPVFSALLALRFSACRRANRLRRTCSQRLIYLLRARVRFYVTIVSLFEPQPDGGVKEGEEFVAYAVVLPDQQQHVVAVVPRYDPKAADAANNPHSVPVGRWRDGICNFAANGPCHPTSCLACWCEPLALGQVMTRLHLTPCGRAAAAPGGRLGKSILEGDDGGKDCRGGSSSSSRRAKRPFWTAFKVLALLFFVDVAVDQAFDYWIDPYFEYDVDGDGNVVMENPHVPTWVLALIGVRAVMRFAFFVYVLVLTIRTRSYVRDRYRIPETRCKGCEDCCFAFWLPCCTITQMARHTADYDTYAAACCTETGLSDHVPEVV